MADPTLPELQRTARLVVYHYRLPLRRRFEHASKAHDASEGLLVRLQLADGTIGLGEGVPRPFVTGETVSSAIEVIRDVYAGRLASEDPLAAGPVAGSAQGVWHNAAWCACELAYLDACARSAGLRLAHYLGQRLERPVHRRIVARVAGVIGSEDAEAIRRDLLRMRLFGLRDFKVKVGFPNDRRNLGLCRARLGRRLTAGKLTLRVDANEAWSLDAALEACRWLRENHVAALEQPLRKGDEPDLPRLQQEGGIPVMVDESLVDYPGAERLAELGAAAYWNLRISKNGGLLQTLRLADLARARGIRLMLGCMVGESGILSAAGRVFLQLAPDVRFLENSYGSFLLAEDLVHERTRFGFGGRIRPLRGPGLGVTLNQEVVDRLAERVADLALT